MIYIYVKDGGARQKSCYYIDTNDTEAEWQQGPVICK